MRTKLFFLAVVLYLSCTSCKKDYEIQEESNIFDTSAMFKDGPIGNDPIVVSGDTDPAYYSQLDPNHPFIISSKIYDGHILKYQANPIYTDSLGAPSDFEWTIEVFNEELNLIFSRTATTPSINVSYIANTTCKFSLNAIYGNTPYNGDDLTIINPEIIVVNEVIDEIINESDFSKDGDTQLSPALHINFCFIYPLDDVIQNCDDTNYVLGESLGDSVGGVTANFILP